MNEIDTLDTLKIENARLIALLETNGIEWHLPVKSNSTATIDQNNNRGRTTIYFLTWGGMILCIRL